MQSGAPAVLMEFLQWMMVLLLQGRTFTFQGRRFRYHHAMYNKTWTNERAVEVPIIRAWMRPFEHGRILEIGNVLSNYFRRRHDVLDKYEVQDGVINEDAVNFRARQPYDLLLSISTIEHIGVDDEEKRPEKALEAIENLMRSLKPDGTFLVSFPLGYNAALDEALWRGRLPFPEVYFMERVSRFNRWRQVSRGMVQGEAPTLVLARRGADV